MPGGNSKWYTILVEEMPSTVNTRQNPNPNDATAIPCSIHVLLLPVLLGPAVVEVALLFKHHTVILLPTVTMFSLAQSVFF
jgi:hypothetical protein